MNDLRGESTLREHGQGGEGGEEPRGETGTHEAGGEPLRERPFRDTFLGEAWMIRRMERDDAVARLRSIGIPVTPWRGTASLASVLLSMEAARSAPRRVLGR